jgi:hypothetical protein
VTGSLRRPALFLVFVDKLGQQAHGHRLFVRAQGRKQAVAKTQRGRLQIDTEIC